MISLDGYAVRNANTRTVYRWEDITDFGSYADGSISLEESARFVRRVWRGEEIQAEVPRILPMTKARKLDINGREAGCWWSTPFEICIDPEYRCRSLVLHELVHAMKLWEHDSRFVKKLVYLLCRYAGCDTGYLINTAQVVGMKFYQIGGQHGN